jgi:hypothetical protein
MVRGREGRAKFSGLRPPGFDVMTRGVVNHFERMDHPYVQMYQRRGSELAERGFALVRPRRAKTSAS